MSCGLLKLFLAQKSIGQYGTTFHYFLEVAVIVLVMRLGGYIISVAAPFELIL